MPQLESVFKLKGFGRLSAKELNELDTGLSIAAPAGFIAHAFLANIVFQVVARCALLSFSTVLYLFVWFEKSHK